MDEMMERCGRYDGGIKSTGLPVLECGKIFMCGNENMSQDDNAEGIRISFQMEEWGRMISNVGSISRSFWFSPDNYSYSIPVRAEGMFSYSGKTSVFKVEVLLGESSLFEGGIKNGDLYDEWLTVDGEEDKNLTFMHRNWDLSCVPDSLMKIWLPKEPGYLFHRTAYVQSCSIEKYETTGWDSRMFQDNADNPLKDSREGLKYQLYVHDESPMLLAEWTDSGYTIFREYSTLDMEHIRRYIVLSCVYMNAYDQVNSRVWYGKENGEDVRYKYNRFVRNVRE